MRGRGDEGEGGETAAACCLLLMHAARGTEDTLHSNGSHKTKDQSTILLYLTQSGAEHTESKCVVCSRSAA